MLYNQWCSVIRWEKTTRPFLRSREFWWQEGHTIHETAEEAQAETEQQLNCYADFFEKVLAIPVVRGRKTDKEKFAGAEATYTVECMMKDRKALQGATSHYFGDKFSRAYNVTFTGRDNKLQYPFQTSWGSTTRMIGAVIMAHGDNNGLVLPPPIAPIQVIILPVAQHNTLYGIVSVPESFFCPFAQIVIVMFKGITHPGSDLIQRNAVPVECRIEQHGNIVKVGQDIRVAHTQLFDIGRVF